MSILKAKWKTVPITDKLQAEGLIGIEECTDYEIDNISDKISKKRPIPVSNEDVVPKKKKKLKKSNKKHEEKVVDLKPSVSGNTSQINEFDETNESDNKIDAWSNFGLHSTILRGIRELGFKEPTPIQSLTLPSAVLGRKDIVGAAETGSGKTLAFGLPILEGILKIKEKENELDSKPLYALILTPTRELAMQIKNHISAVCKYTGINVAVVVGGMAAVKQERILSRGPEIVVATPGRLWELIQQGNEHLSQVDNVHFLVIDETDRMLEKGHFQELNNLFERINLDEEKVKTRQNFIFSATLTLVHDLPDYLKNKQRFKSKKIENMTPEQKLKNIIDMLRIKDPKIVDLSEGKGTSTTLTECKITCNIEEKDMYLFYFLKRHPGRTLVFCNSIGCVKRLSALLNLLNCNPLPLHASMQQRQRLKNIEKFSNTKDSILIATDVAARGLDIPHIDHVIHYQTPRTSENYVHRSGRTARASREGISIVFIEPSEFQRYIKLCRTLGKFNEIPTFPVEQNYLNAIKKIMDLARELDTLQLHVKKANAESSWFQKAAEDVDIIIDDFNSKYDTKETQSYKKALDVKKKQLTSLLSKPIFPKGFIGKYPMLTQLPQIDEKDALSVAKNIPKTVEQKRNRLFKPRNKEMVNKGYQHSKIKTMRNGNKKNKKSL